MTEKQKVLFLCSHNSARSVMAEAILRDLAGDRFEVYSAGLESRGVHPLTLRVLKEQGLPTEDLTSNAAKEYLGRMSVRHAIVVCGEAAEKCPTVFPFGLHFTKWPFPDPSKATGSEEERLQAFREVFHAIRERITEWLEEQASVPATARDQSSEPQAQARGGAGR